MLDLQVFAERLKSARAEKGVSQNELAKTIGVAPGTVSTYENPNGGNRYPAFEKAVAIAECLGVSLDWLCGISEQESKEKTAANLLGDLLNIISEFGLVTTIQTETGNNRGVSIYGVNPHYADFFDELKKIIPILEDEKIPEYLKDGLKATLLERYKNFTISDFRNEIPF